MRVHSLKTKTAVTVSLLVVLLVTATASFIFSYFESIFKEMIAGQEFTLVAGMAQEIDNKLDRAHNGLIAISKVADPAVLTDSDKAQAFLDAQAGLRTIFDNGIYFFSLTGEIIAESPYVPGRRGLNYSHREYIKRTVEVGRPYIGEPYKSSHAHGHPAIMLTAPLFAPEGKMIGIMAGSLDLLKDNFLGSLARTKIGQSGYVYMYDTQRTLIVHPEIERTLKKVPPGVNKLFDMAIEGFEGTAETIDSRGNRQLTSFKRLGKTNWILAASHPIDEVYASVIKARLYFIVAVFIGTLLLILGIWYLVGHFTAPLVAFTKHVEDLGGKTGTARFSAIFPNDEIGALSTAFNNMLRELDSKTVSLEKSEELYRTIIDFASDMVFWRGPSGEILYVSPNCERITGYLDSEFYSRPHLLDDIVHPEDKDNWLAYTRRGSYRMSGVLEFRIVTKEGGVRWINCVTRPVYNEKGEYCGIRGSHQDISDRKQAEERLHYISLHDSLTGFKNRACFEKELGSFARPDCLPVSVAVCDVDGLKFVNDTLGHSTGDELLRKVAGILKRHFAAHVSLYRIGGDEFIAVLPATDGQAVEESCQGLQKAIAIHNNNCEIPVSMSIGFATSDADSVNMASLFKEADDNMYREKLIHSQSVRSTTLTALTKTLETRDHLTADNARRIQELATLAAKTCGMTDKSFAELGLLAQFHDVGKIGVPDNILFKPGTLTAKEREKIERHAEIGYRIAISTPDLAPIAELILKHHEWWNGKGYPLRLKGDQIPLECRLFAIIDAYDAMTSERPYRPAMTKAQALAEIERCAGTQFDPRLAKLFIALLADQEKGV
jgi:diguanylate cyclase (GGDEF)-like protein/PAS domain S-box-containing protein